MHSAIIVILHAIIVPGLADDSVDKFVDKLGDKLVDRLRGMSPLQLGNLDDATSAKTHADKGSALPMSRVQPIHSMQAYSPYNAKKAEALSYLPQMDNTQIGKQIQYMINNRWTPALEISDDADVYLNTRMGPGYYDNRYWSMYKLPMFGCTNPQDVVREIEACKREFPHAKVRVMAYDPVKQVQVAGFVVQK